MTPTQVFPHEFCKIFKKTYFIEHLQWLFFVGLRFYCKTFIAAIIVYKETITRDVYTGCVFDRSNVLFTSYIHTFFMLIFFNLSVGLLSNGSKIVMNDLKVH